MKRTGDHTDLDHHTVLKRMCLETTIHRVCMTTSSNIGKRPLVDLRTTTSDRKRVCRQEMYIRRYLCEYDYTDTPMCLDVIAYYG